MYSRLIIRIADKVSLSLAETLSVVKRSPFSYKVYTIPKKREGTRTIAQPAKEVKAIQRALYDIVLRPFPVHTSATAYKPGSSIKKNALIHAQNQYLLKMDFKNFFPSIVPVDFEKYILKNNSTFRFTNVEIKELINILFWKPKQYDMQLSIGAPTSPFVSNFLLYEFDSFVNSYAASVGVSYSRYADDLTFTSINSDSIHKIYKYIVNLCKKRTSPRLVINSEKTVYSSKKHRRRVTGLIISNDGEVSIGREKKRIIRSMLHYYVNNKLNAEEISFLKGYLAFLKDVDDAFYNKIIEKYEVNIHDM